MQAHSPCWRVTRPHTASELLPKEFLPKVGTNAQQPADVSCRDGLMQRGSHIEPLAPICRHLTLN